MAFVRRLINVIFVIGEGSFGTAGSDQVELSGLRVSGNFANAGGRAMGTAQLTIYGMTLSLMNQLSTLGMIATQERRNSVTVTAGDEGKTLSTVFQGTIRNAWADFSAAPEVAFRVDAFTGLFDAVRPVQPLSIRGGVDVATVLSGLATQMGMAFTNAGVSKRIANPYYAGSAFVQAQAIVKDAGIEWNAGEAGVLAIWNPGQARDGAAVVIAPPPDGGMIGYPTFNSVGISVRTIYNPSIGLGSRIVIRNSAVQSAIVRSNLGEGANGEKAVQRIDHSLDSLVPGGRWDSTIVAVRPSLLGQVAA